MIFILKDEVYKLDFKDEIYTLIYKNLGLNQFNVNHLNFDCH